MKISYNWLKEYVRPLPKPEKLVELLTMHSFEVAVANQAGNDWILDIEVLSNRAHDCLSHIGIARECAALLKLKIKSPKFQPKAGPPRAGKVEDFVSIEVKDTDLCPRYCARIITDIKVGPSPHWLREKLEVIGQKSINNVVDAANYLMLETGQPLHAFDCSKIGGKKIVVRKAKRGEKIITLDNEAYELNNDILVIADAQEPLAIAGIKGGKKAEINENTKTIVLESANFNLNNIHATSRKLGLQTEASLRFEHGLDPNLASEAVDRAAGLISEIGGGKTAKGIIDIYPWKLRPKKVAIKIGKINSLLGVEISEKEIIEILNSLEFKTKIISPIKELIKLAKSLTGKPYKYGASTSQEAPNVFDCSSFTRYLFRQIGKEIPRPSIEQIGAGKPVDKKDLKPGDLIFAKRGGKGIGHVGLYIGNNKVIHASGAKKKVFMGPLSDLTKPSQWRGACRILEDEDYRLLVEVPTRRLDIELPEDLVEEIGRIYGYENILSKPPLGILVSAKVDDLLRLKNKVKDILDGLGLSEVYNYSFIGEKELEKLKANPTDYLELENPLSADLKYLRRDLLISLLKNTKDNFRYFDEVRLFELGKVYPAPIKNICKAPDIRQKRSVSDRCRVYLKDEKMMLAGVVGKKTDKTELFYEIKGMVDGLLNKLGISGQWYDDFKATPEDASKIFWHPTKSAEIKIDNQEIGFLGEINPEILSKFDIKGKVAVFNIDFELLTRLVEEELIYQHPSKFPAIIRDVAVLVNLNDRVNSVLNVMESAGGDLVQDIDLFDMYEGEEIPEGKKNLAFHIIYQSQNRTLTDKEVDEIHDRIVKALERRRGWEVRK